MARLLSFVLPFLMYGSAFAEEPQDLPPTVGTGGIVLFLVLFVGMCVGFFVYLWWSEKKRKEREGKPAK